MMYPGVSPGKTPTATNWPDGSAASAVFPWFPRPNGPNSGSMPTKPSPLPANWMTNWQKLASAKAYKRRRGKLEDLFSRGKQVACGCNSRNGFLKNIKPPAQNTDEAYESYFETILGKRLKRVKGTDLALPNSPVKIPEQVLDQWIKDGRIRSGVPHELDNYIKNYKPKKIQLEKD